MGVNPYAPGYTTKPVKGPLGSLNAPAGGQVTNPTGVMPPQNPKPKPMGPQAPVAPRAQAPAAAAPDPYGTESGLTYVEQRYLDRMNGTDPAYEYALKRGTETLGNRFSAASAFNSGAARQAEGDFYANALAQSQGQLDTLAGAASGARQRKTDSMFGAGLSLAGGQAGTVSPYALGAAGAMSAADQAYLYMMLNKAGVEGQAKQGALNTVFDVAKLFAPRPGGGATK